MDTGRLWKDLLGSRITGFERMGLPEFFRFGNKAVIRSVHRVYSFVIE